MEEASPIKFYLARYFFLALSALQAMAAILMFTQLETSPKTRFVAFAFFTLAMIFFSLHMLISKKIKRVALSKKKIEVINPTKVKCYDWEDVKRLKFIPYLNMYSLKLKGKGKIYFLSTQSTATTILGLSSGNSDLIPKKVR
jgi:hypothetical protein